LNFGRELGSTEKILQSSPIEEEFFILIDNFLSDVDKFTPKTETKKKIDRKHEVGKKVMEAVSQQTSNNMEELLKAMKDKQNK
jgi:hypothetical protein